MYLLGLVVVLLVVCKSSDGANIGIEKITNCKAMLSGKKLLDLTSLDSVATPMTASDDAYNIAYNPCTGLPCVRDKPETAAVCKRTKFGNYVYNVGDQDSVIFSYPTDDPSIVLMTFKTDKFTTQVGCFCDTTVDKRFELVTNAEDMLVLKLTSKCCCPDGCGTGGGGGGGDTGKGLSFGSILLIILFSGLFVYFVGGFAFLKFYKHTSGITESIPNYEFWRTSLPESIKEGFVFVKGKASSYRRI